VLFAEQPIYLMTRQRGEAEVGVTGRRQIDLSARETCRDYSGRLINDADDMPPIRIIGSASPAECFVKRSVYRSCFVFIYIIAFTGAAFSIID